MTRPALRVEALPLGGGTLSQAMRTGALPAAIRSGALHGPSAFVEQARAVLAEWTVARRAATRAWIGEATGYGAASASARARFDAALERGLLITTGQQPGLFGGPLYTWHKALSALALADALEPLLGVPVAPLFWAATDDTDFAEGAATWVPTTSGSVRVDIDPPPGAGDGVPTALLPLPDMATALAQLEAACGSAADPSVLRGVRAAYGASSTVGGAYLALLRAQLEPRGMLVLDAAHPSVRAAAHPVAQAALQAAPAVAHALHEREVALRAAGLAAQVEQVDGLSLVFEWRDGVKRRVPIPEAGTTAATAGEAALSGNVLLRPVIERTIVPTMTYVAGPAELAYFAQVDVVADALGCPRPAAVPRWSARIVEARVGEALEALGVPLSEFAVPERVLHTVSRAELPEAIVQRLAMLRSQVSDGVRAVMEASHAIALPSAIGEGAATQLSHRLDRLERRIVARAAQLDHARRARIALVAGALHPGGLAQERALNAIPLLARHGEALWSLWRAGAAEWASHLLDPSA